jgi:hypothetical protein
MIGPDDECRLGCNRDGARNQDDCGAEFATEWSPKTGMAVGQKRSDRVSPDEQSPLHPKRAAQRNQQFIHAGDKKLKALQKAAWDAGWWPERKKNGIMWFAPSGAGHVMVHGSSSDHHALANLTSEFRKAGLTV